jgi:hypothetical protein
MAYMKKPKTLAKAIQRKRVLIKGFPKKPKTFDDLATIPTHLQETFDGQQFLVLNDTVIQNDPSPNAKRLLVYMSETGRDTLLKATTWFCDGTWREGCRRRAW